MNRPFYVCLSHDVDRVTKTFQSVTHFFKNLKTGNISGAMYQLYSIFLKNHYWCFPRIMDLEEKLGVRSTFFFLHESYPVNLFKPKSWRIGLGYYNIQIPRIQEIIRELDRKGWEIGLHGSFRSHRDTALLQSEKKILEGIVNHPVSGVRQHYLNLSEKTWELQANAGFLYDASFGFTNDIGFRDNRLTAFKPFDSREFFVVPLALMDSCVMGKSDPLAAATAIIEKAECNEGCLVLNWHQRIFNKYEFPGYIDLYIKIIQECQKRKAHFLTINEFITLCKNRNLF